MLLILAALTFDSAGLANKRRYRRILVQRKTCPRSVVILHVREEHVAQVPLAEYHDMIKTFLSDQ